MANAHRFRRVAAVITAVLVLGIGIHGATELFEHEHGGVAALVVCTTALALLTTLGTTGPGARTPSPDRLAWAALPQTRPAACGHPAGRMSAAWLQRFQN